MRCATRRAFGFGFAVCLGNHISHQLPLVPAPRASDHRFPNGRLGGERGLDLARLDAEAADLDLMVEASKELDVAVGPIAGQIAGLVETFSHCLAEEIGNEFFSSELGAVEVAPGETGATDV